MLQQTSKVGTKLKTSLNPYGILQSNKEEENKKEKENQIIVEKTQTKTLIVCNLNL